MFCIHTSTTTGSWTSTLSLPGLTTHKSPAYKNLAHQPIKHNHNSFQNLVYSGLALGTLQFPSPYFCTVLSAIYIVSASLSKFSKRCGYSARITSSCSHVVSSRPYQVHWTFTSSIARFQGCLLFLSNMHT
jgi:hypothetical protein